MTWAKVDDRLHSHPKAQSAGPAAMGLWVLAMSHCMAYLTDGNVTRKTVESLVGSDGVSMANRLVAVGLWEHVGEDFRFHDWHGYQPSARKIKAERKATATRVKRHRNAVTPPVSNAPPGPGPVPIEEEEKKKNAPPQPPVVRCPTVEHASDIDPQACMFELAKTGSGWQTHVSTGLFGELKRAILSITPAVTLEDFRLLGEAHAAGAAWNGFKSSPPTVQQLVKDNAAVLSEGLSNSRRHHERLAKKLAGRGDASATILRLPSSSELVTADGVDTAMREYRERRRG